MQSLAFLESFLTFIVVLSSKALHKYGEYNKDVSIVSEYSQ